MKKLLIAGVIIYMIASLLPGLASMQVQDQVKRETLLKVDPVRIAIITPSSGVQFYKNGIVLLSNTRNEDRMVQNQISFGRADAYYEAFKDTTKGIRTPFSRSALFEVPVDGMTFSSDFNTMYYTKRVSMNEPEKIFRARYQAVKGSRDWVQDSKPLSFCNDGANYSHPSLSSGGEMMVFASDRGGEFDIYITRIEGTTWTDPENAGKEINSAGNELFPFLDQNSNLYFSSDGHKGLGGYDIFFCRYNGTGWNKPVNLTDRINTGNDEFAFTLDRTNGQTAFFTRRPDSGKSGMRLFRVTFQDKTALNKLTDLSNAFEYLAMGTLPAVIPQTPASVPPARVDVAIAASKQNPEKKETPTENKPVVSETTAQLKSQTDIAPEQKPAVIKKEVSPSPVVQPASKVNEVVYRVQFATYSKPKGSYEITVGGVKYNTFEYLYNGSYRACAGEFTSKIQASALQKVFKQAGYADAFVVAFKNNVRSLDPALFK